MWKKWLNIFLCIWLINAVTYFHAANPFEINGDDQLVNAAAFHPKINTWADCFFHQSPDEDNAPVLPHKIDSHRRYVNSRTHGFSVFVPGILATALFTAPKNLIFNCNNNYAIGVALLPNYYSFLFRLCPF